ncbi:MAG: hypothetical protein OTJ97_08945, partial [SAR202 cluster bacterium]|nr:hypothetical protein [SAR202 cluster bacterium]
DKGHIMAGAMKYGAIVTTDAARTHYEHFHLSPPAKRIFPAISYAENGGSINSLTLNIVNIVTPGPDGHRLVPTNGVERNGIYLVH